MKDGAHGKCRGPFRQDYRFGCPLPCRYERRRRRSRRRDRDRRQTHQAVKGGDECGKAVIWMRWAIGADAAADGEGYQDADNWPGHGGAARS